MDTLALQCSEIDDMGGWFVVHLNFYSNDPSIYAGGVLSFQITDASRFVIGKCYDLNLNEVPTA